MGLLQAAYRTYQTQAHRAGKKTDGEREALTPLAHILQNAQIEISLSDAGQFQGASPVPKEDAKTIIPATMESANRTSKAVPHPLCDQLGYLDPHGPLCEEYIQQLTRWADSPFSHTKVRAVLRYIRGGTILQDLASAGLIELREDGSLANGKCEGTAYEKCLVRWRIFPAPEGQSSACWKDSSLFDSFAAFYTEKEGQKRDLCFISGEQDRMCESHPKGTVASSYGAKLISSNDGAGFTYRGRFAQAEQAFCVGYTASQMAHNALRWVAANHGVLMGGRTFLCWNPEGQPVPPIELWDFGKKEERDFISYRRELQDTLNGYRQGLRQRDVVIAALDAATTGRLSITYYNELQGSDFLDRVESWYETSCWSTRWGIRCPSIWQIVTCAFGTQRGERLEADDRLLKEHAQQMVHSIVDRQPVPHDVVRALVIRAGTPLAYTPQNREKVLETACAMVRKYRRDRHKEEWTLALDTQNQDRSYLFGRFLAIAEQVERSTYEREEGREPNAIRLQAVFAQRPLYASRILNERLLPYLARLKPGLRAYYRRLLTEVMNPLEAEAVKPDRKLDDTYLLGYYHQRAALFNKKESWTMEGQTDADTES